MRKTLFLAAATGFLSVACNDPTAPQTLECKLSQSAPQSVVDRTQTDIVFDKSDCALTGGPQGIILPAGTWTVNVQIVWSPNSNGERGSCIFFDQGVLVEDGRKPMSTAGTIQSMSYTFRVDSPGYLRVTGTQTSGTTLQTMVNSKAGVLTFVKLTRL